MQTAMPMLTRRHERLHGIPIKIDEQRRRKTRLEATHSVDRFEGERRHYDPRRLSSSHQQRRHFERERPVPIRSPLSLVLLDLDVDLERPAGVQRLAERRKPRRQLCRQEAGERPKSGYLAVMVDDYVAVSGEVNVQLDPVRAKIPRRRTRRRCSPWPDDTILGGRRSRSQRSPSGSSSAARRRDGNRLFFDCDRDHMLARSRTLP